jgi:hypothetical protein
MCRVMLAGKKRDHLKAGALSLSCAVATNRATQQHCEARKHFVNLVIAEW